MLTYDDIKKMRLGEQAMIQQKAQQAIEEEAFNLQQANAGMEQQVQQEDQLTMQAQEALQAMHQAEQNGQDPMKIAAQLPPEVQDRVAALMKSELEEQGQEPHNDMDADDNVAPTGSENMQEDGNTELPDDENYDNISLAQAASGL